MHIVYSVNQELLLFQKLAVAINAFRRRRMSVRGETLCTVSVDVLPARATQRPTPRVCSPYIAQNSHYITSRTIKNKMLVSLQNIICFITGDKICFSFF